MNPSMNYPILSGEMLDKRIEEIRNRLIFLEARQAQLNHDNLVVSASQKAKPPVDFFPDWMLIPRFPYKVAISDQQDLWARGQQCRR